MRVPIFKIPTPEEAETMRKEIYEARLHTPENFSNWFPLIREAMINSETSMKYPESTWHTLPYEWIKWLESDNYTEYFREIILPYQIY